MKKCYIFGAGELFGSPTVSSSDLIIAADGGTAHLKSLGIKPDMIVGDFDSMGSSFSEKCEDPELSGVEIARFPVKKDDTDMMLAYKIGASRGYDEFHIYGGVGGREDHTFANYSLLLYAKNEGKTAFLYNKTSRVRVIKNEKIELHGAKGKTVSLFAFGGEARGVFVSGLEYELSGGTLSVDFPLGVSNSHGHGGFATVEVKDGALIVFEEL